MRGTIVRSSRRGIALAWWVALSGAACSLERGFGAFPDQDAAPPDPDGAVVGPAGDATLDDELRSPAGTWMLFLENPTCLNALGQSKEQIIWTWYRVAVEDRGPGGRPEERHLRQRLRFCRQEVSPALAGLQTYIPDAIPASLPELTVDAVLLGPTPGSRYVSGELFETMGMRDIGAEDPLPEGPDDPRVFDQDEDGHPGVTFVVGEDLCEVYVAQRTRTRLTGEVRNAGLVEGTLWSRVEKVVLDATQPLCRTENEIVPSGGPSRFALVRIDGRGGAYDFDLDGDGAIDCAEIAEARRFFAETGVARPREPRADACQ